MVCCVQFPFPRSHRWNRTVCSRPRLLHCVTWVQVSAASSCGLTARSYSATSRAPWPGWTTVYASVHLLTGILVTAEAWPSAMKLLQTSHTGFCVGTVFAVLACLPWSTMTGSRGESLRNCHAALKAAGPRPPSSPRCPASSQRLATSGFWVLAAPIGLWWCLAFFVVSHFAFPR